MTGDGTQAGCHCTGAESIDCVNYCPFAGAYDEEETSDDSGDA